MAPLKIHLVAGARPNFMKIGPLFHALEHQAWARAVVVHTGQHYDENMSDAFFRDMKLPRPDYFLGVGGGSHAEQTGRLMVAYEKLALEDRPHWVVVVGDVNSTLACAITAKKLCLPVAHLEAGLRSTDRTMPEEINRLVTDSISDLLWAPSADAVENLKREGVPGDRIELVGNIMIDAYEDAASAIAQAGVPAEMSLDHGKYGVVTLHRPSNVDHCDQLTELVEHLKQAATIFPMVFPVHPRTEHRLKTYGLWTGLANASGVRLCEPMGYIRFMSLVSSAGFTLTDSGGVQEETTYLGIPCLTLRTTTERPITVWEGTNRLIRPADIVASLRAIAAGGWPLGRRPHLWDGRTAPRVVESLSRIALDGCGGRGLCASPEYVGTAPLRAVC